MSTRSATTYVIIALTAGAWAAGCGTQRTTDTPRTATEQLMVTAAVEQAVSQLDFEFLEDRKVFMDASLVDRVDKSFVTAEVRASARCAGVILVDQRKDAEYVLELRVGAAGTDRTEYILGIPAGKIPMPGGSMGIPEAPLYKSITQVGACQVGFVVYAEDDGRFFYASGPAYGFADHKSRWILGAGPGVRDNIAPPRAPENTSSIRRRASSLTPPEKPQ